MLSVKSKSMAEYVVRLLFVILLGLAIHCAMVVMKGDDGKSAFDFDRPERGRSLLMVVLVVGAAAVVMLPTAADDGKMAKKGGEQAKTTLGDAQPKVVEQPATVDAPTPVESSRPVERPEPVEQTKPVEQPEVVEAQASPVVSDRVDVPEAKAEETVVESGSPAELKNGETLADEMTERMWRSARRIRHNFIPDVVHDSQYLNLLHGAAMLGHPKAQAKLGDYALRRGALVEAYYWMKLSQLNGFAAAEANLVACRERWMRSSCPLEYENVYELFTARQGSLGRAFLRLDCGVRSEQARQRLRSMAAEGEAVAVLILGEMPEGGDS